MVFWPFENSTFRHGIHPPELERRHQRSANPPVPLCVRRWWCPFRNTSVGRPSLSSKKGKEVTRGQCLAEPDGFLSVAMHAPASGVVRRIGLGAEHHGPNDPRRLH